MDEGLAASGRPKFDDETTFIFVHTSTLYHATGLMGYSASREPIFCSYL
jgi:hypothetical protein